MTTYTTNLKLEKYDNNDLPNLRDQYNASMDILDANTGQFNSEVAKLNTAILNADTAIQDNAAKLEELTAEVATNETVTIANKNAIDSLTAKADELTTKQQDQQTTLDTAVGNITVLQGTSEGHTESITTINGELAGLGIESVDDAVALKSDIAANTMFGNWEYRDGTSPGSTWFNSFNVGLMISPNKSYIRVIGGFSTGSSSPSYTKTAVPGLTNKYGVKAGISVPEITNAPRSFTYAGVQFLKTEIPEGYILGICNYAIGSDHELYVDVSGSNTVDSNTKVLFFQIPMVINVSGFNAVD